MTEDIIAFGALSMKASNAFVSREMTGFAVQRLMEPETDTLCGARQHERTKERII